MGTVEGLPPDSTESMDAEGDEEEVTAIESVDVMENASELRDPSNDALSAVNPPPPPEPPSKDDFSFPNPVLATFGIDAGSILTSFAF
ncbi:hypothetical protein ABT160_10270 [Streptomyces sp. NPDC001941]|uniref:hypothetical protein n=1 Tax=Streptomyces sp. NPDC001941 TaxID=3154659 RepID=UPI00331FC593